MNPALSQNLDNSFGGKGGMNFPVAYEDDGLLVIDKPPGLLVIATPKNERRTLTALLNETAKEKEGARRLYPCHRLDRETSGLIIYAKGKSIQKKMMDEFRAGRVKKTYFAFVQGALPKDQGRIDSPVEGKRSTTCYQVLERRKNFSVILVHPLSGRTNQIRIHFKRIGHPLVGESKFAYRRDYKLRHKRVCLHAASLLFTHPATKKNTRIDCELAPDLRTFLETHNA
jgi:23S rRNA pseudouridine1911/1915/1917 synthase